MRSIEEEPVVMAEDERFGFGANWQSFLAVVDDERIAAAERSLRDMLGVDHLDGLRFLDVGSGSGLFSLAARRLGATVRSFDYDSDSVACTRAMRDRFRPDDDGWVIEQGSALDRGYLETLGRHDVVYSWGVLHHTGDMWTALANATELVADGGALFIALYNDQGKTSERWAKVKRAYNDGGRLTRAALVGAVGAAFAVRIVARRVTRTRTSSTYAKRGAGARGMNRWHDLVDWVGGYPFEVATPGAVLDFVNDRGFRLDVLRTVGGNNGCNEYVFRRT